MDNEEIRLVIKAQNGDSTAFAELARRYRTVAYAAAYAYLHDHSNAEDIAQEALLTAYEKISNLRQLDKFGAWLGAIAAWKSRRFQQKQRTYESIQSVSIKQVAENEYDIWNALETGKLRDAVNGIVTELSRLHREAIELYYFQGYTISEIAKFLDVPVGTVKRRLYDARDKLRKVLSDPINESLLEEIKEWLK